MPGIAGIFSSDCNPSWDELAGRMVGSMVHENFYRSGFLSESSLGVHAGWSCLEGNSWGPPSVSNLDGTVSLLLSGEIFPDPGEAERLGFSGGPSMRHGQEWVLARYEALGEGFFKSLNGVFSGLLIDRRIGKAFLFTDRYGLDRIYVHTNRGNVFFASEAKAILRVVPDTRAFDESGVAQYLAYGCTRDETTLFKDIKLLPGGSCLSFDGRALQKRLYFTPRIWESQAKLQVGEFQEELGGLLKKIVPRYAACRSRLGISLTAGLDTRMIMANLPASTEEHVCFTYSGESIDPLDARISAKIAKKCGLEHHSLHIGKDFFSEFAEIAAETVRLSDGCFGVLGAHEIYMSRLARHLAPVRLTGNYGSEILRGVSTMKPQFLDPSFLSPVASAAVKREMTAWKDELVHPVTFAAFRETPRNLYGNLQAGRSQLGFRTPYLDNDFVQLSYQGPADAANGRQICEDIVRQANAGVASIPTDMGYLGERAGIGRALSQFGAKVAFKLDYLSSVGLPSAVSPAEPLLHSAMKTLGIMGLHKHLTYRRWLRCELADWLRQACREVEGTSDDLWSPQQLKSLAEAHISGRANMLKEINAVLTLASIRRQLFSTT